MSSTVEAFFLKVLQALEYHVVTRMVSPTEEPMQYLNEEPCWHLKGHGFKRIVV